MAESGETSRHCGLRQHQVHPCGALFRQLQEELMDEDFNKMKILSKDKLGTNDVADWNQFFGILQEKFEGRWLPLLTFLKNVAKETGKHVETGSRKLENVIQEYIVRFKEELEILRVAGIAKDENFVGRTKEISEICDFLSEDTVYISGVSICGLAGMGKTSVASEVCYRFKQGSDVCIIKKSLRGKFSLTDLYTSILHAVMEASNSSDPFYNPDVPEDVLKNSIYLKLKSLEKDVILFLDNIEGVVHKEGANFLNAFREILRIPTTKQVKIVLTTRKKLVDSEDDIGESVFTKRFDGSILEVLLKGLEQRDARKLLKCYTGDVQILNEESREIVKLCGQCPLVIKIMGNYLKSSPDIKPEVVIDRLKSVTSTFGEADITACFNEMFDALSKPLQKILIQLSVFETTFAFDMAKAIISRPQAEELLKELRSHHLLEVEVKDEAQDLEDEQWKFAETLDYGLQKQRKRPKVTRPDAFLYSFHPTVLRFLKQKIKQDRSSHEEEVTQAETRFCQYFYKYIKVKLGQQLDKNSSSACYYILDQTVHLGRFFTLLQENRLQLQARTKEDVQCLFRLSKVRSYVGNRFRQLEFFQKLGEHKEREGDELFVFYAKVQELISERILDNVRRAKMLQGILETMVSRIEALPEFCPAFRNLAFADYYSLMGRVCLDQANYKEGKIMKKPILNKALDLFKKALDFYASENSYTCSEIAQVTNCMGCAYFQLEEYDKAQTYHEKAVDLIRRYQGKEDHADMSNYYVNIGSVYHAKGSLCKPDSEAAQKNYKRALDYYKKATDMDKKLGFPDELVEARRLRNMADIYRRLTEYIQAYRSGNQAFRIFQRHFQPPHIELTTTLHLLGHIQYCKGKAFKKEANNELTDEAEDAFKKAEDIYDDVTHMMKYGGLSRDHQDYTYIKQTHENVMTELGDKDELRRVRNYYRDLEAGKFDKKIKKVQRQIAGESSGSEEQSDSDEEEEEELFEGGGEEEAVAALHRQDSGFDGSIDYDVAQLQQLQELPPQEEELEDDLFLEDL